MHFFRSIGGKGLGTEAAHEIVRVGFEQIGLPNIICFTMTTNKPSQRVMEKAGFAYERDLMYKEIPHVLYRLTADEWKRRQGK